MELKHTHLLLRIVGAVLACLIGASTVAVSGGALVEGRLPHVDAPWAQTKSHARRGLPAANLNSAARLRPGVLQVPGEARVLGAAAKARAGRPWRA